MPAPSRRAKRADRLTTCALLLAPALLTLLATPALAQSSPAAAPAATPTSAHPGKTAREILDERYVIGPTPSDEFGYRIAWQTEALSTKGSETQLVNPGSDSIWFADSGGSVVRVRRDNGETVWRASTFKGLERILSVDHLPLGSEDRVYVVTDINCIALDALTGSLARTSTFGALPTSAPAAFGPYFIAGTRAGVVYWYQYGAGYSWRATTIGGSVLSEPTLAGDIVLAGSTSGTVLAMEAGSTRVIWDRKLSAGVEARIAVDQQAAFVAGRDQTLWAFDLARGRVLWNYFTQAQLLNDPVRIADGLYLQIPGEGLVSFNPHPKDRPDGEVRWKSTAPGKVIGRLGTNLLVWEKSSHTFSFVDAGNGRIVSQRQLPQVATIESVPVVNGDLYASSPDGRLERLDPLARPAVPTGIDQASPMVERAAPAATAPAVPPATAPAAPPAGGDAHAAPSTAPRFNQRLR